LLWCAHLAYAFHRSSQAGGSHVAKTPRVAVWYMGTSFAIFILSFAALAVLRPIH
jgi:hypothetical protein